MYIGCFLFSSLKQYVMKRINSPIAQNWPRYEKIVLPEVIFKGITFIACSMGIPQLHRSFKNVTTRLCRHNQENPSELLSWTSLISHSLCWWCAFSGCQLSSHQPSNQSLKVTFDSWLIVFTLVLLPKRFIRNLRNNCWFCQIRPKPSSNHRPEIKMTSCARRLVCHYK